MCCVPAAAERRNRISSSKVPRAAGRRRSCRASSAGSENGSGGATPVSWQLMHSCSAAGRPAGPGLVPAGAPGAAVGPPGAADGASATSLPRADNSSFEAPRAARLRRAAGDGRVVAGEALESSPRLAPERARIELREPPAGGVRDTEQRVLIRGEGRPPRQLSRDGLRLEPRERNPELGVRGLLRDGGVLAARTRSEGPGIGKALYREELTITRVRRLAREERREPRALARREPGAIALAIGAGPERKAVPHGPGRRPVTAGAVRRIHLGHLDLGGAGRRVGKHQLAQPELLLHVVELHGLDDAEAALRRAAVDGQDEAGVGPEKNHARIFRRRPLETAALEHEGVAAALRGRERRQQLLDAADILTPDERQQRCEVEASGPHGGRGERRARQQTQDTAQGARGGAYGPERIAGVTHFAEAVTPHGCWPL